MSWRAQAEEFLKVSGQFRLGDLPTEQQNPRTMKLSELAINDLPSAIELLLAVERTALDVLLSKTDSINQMADSIHRTFADGGRVFFCGCGATGRLSLSIERLWRQLITENSTDHSKKDAVLSFMAGGDYALVHSIENFEDFPEYGARQLNDLGFREGDLLISTTEGGETPFVIGATLEAVRVSKRSPYFLYCNPDAVLLNGLQRCRDVILNEKIYKISLPIGPMAISGSTRLQATTVLMLAAASALFKEVTHVDPAAEILDLKMRLRGDDFFGLASLIEQESAYYSADSKVIHAAKEYAITVLTDLTERSPTFSLNGLKNYRTRKEAPPSWTYLWIPNTAGVEESWRDILDREPRCLNWDGFSTQYGLEAAYGFDFSDRGREIREAEISEKKLPVFEIAPYGGFICLSQGNFTHKIRRPESLLIEHLIVKIALNISSNLVMSRLGRVHGNLMLWVHASNNKLIDRAARYVQSLLRDEGLNEKFTYEQIVYEIFRLRGEINRNEAIVVKTFNSLKALA